MRVGIGLVLTFVTTTVFGAQDRVGVVCNVKVISDKVEDVTTLEDWKRSCIKPGMTNDQKAVAIWKAVVKYRHQCPPPNEFLQNEKNVHDVMKTVHVYGYGMCCCAASNVEQLARYIGFKARGWAITVHSVPEVFYDGAWHLLDGSLMNYFRNPDGSIASVEQISRAVVQWHKAHPGYRGSDAKLRRFARGGNWKKSGPPLLATSQTYTTDGPNPAGWHGWSSAMVEYDRPDRHFIYEYGYSQGYRLNVQLRPGERLTRNWFNKGLHINMDGSGGSPGRILKSRAPLGLQRRLGDLAPGRIGNGTLEYAPPLADPAFLASALVAENLAAGTSPTLSVKDPAKPAVLVVRMPSSYVYLGGEAAMEAAVGPGGSIVVSFSDNNGLDWRELARLTATGTTKLDLKPHVYRRYDYRLRCELRGRGTGLNALGLTHDIQHAQTPLPALGQGENTITFSAGPPEGTITIEAAANPDFKDKQLVLADFHPELRGVKPRLLRVEKYDRIGGSVTFPIETPGEMVRIRAGAHYRARDKREGWTLEVSFDGGKSFAEIGKLPGPTPGSCRYSTFGKVPAGTRKALVRFRSTRQYNTLCIFNLRIDADYREPAGGFRPVKIVYVWEEGGQARRHTHIATRPNDTYKITCPTPPLMKSIILELAD